MGTPGGPIEANIESGFNLAHFVVYSTGSLHKVLSRDYLGITRGLLRYYLVSIYGLFRVSRYALVTLMYVYM